MPRNILYPDDKLFGEQQEAVVLPIIREYFKRDIKCAESRFSPYDFYDEEGMTYELKSRSNRFSQYPTTMITADKVKEGRPVTFLFRFTDGVYFIRYDPNKFKNYHCQDFSRAGVRWNEKPHFYIPIQDLTLIHTFPKRIYCLLPLPKPTCISSN